MYAEEERLLNETCTLARLPLLPPPLALKPRVRGQKRRVQQPVGPHGLVTTSSSYLEVARLTDRFQFGTARGGATGASGPSRRIREFSQRSEEEDATLRASNGWSGRSW